MKTFGKNSGMTMVEMGVVLVIAAIVMTGMLSAYTDGIRYWRSASEKSMLYNEGSTALIKISKWIRGSSFIRIKSMSGLPNARLELRYPSSTSSAEFYFVESDKSLKWNDQTEGRNQFNKTLLPEVRFRTGGYDDEPYLYVKQLRFLPLDDIGQGSPQLVGYSLVKIEMVLEDQKGDTLYLSSVASKRNK